MAMSIDTHPRRSTNRTVIAAFMGLFMAAVPALAQERVPSADENLRLCLAGNDRGRCDRTHLTPQQIVAADEAEYQARLRFCMVGIYSNSCDHDALRVADRPAVQRAEYGANLRTCLISARYPCRLEILAGADVALVAKAAYASNLSTCLRGAYPALCDHESLSPSDLSGVTAAEKRAAEREASAGHRP